MKQINRILSVVVGAATAGVSAMAYAEAPAAWTCDPSAWEDAVCDCGCGAVDTDCPAGTFVVCETSACPDGQVPWEHAPESCMASACGDGWADLAGGEACDDFEALAGGGCNADCSAVNPGWECGDRATGCMEEAEDDVGEADAGGEADAAEDDAGGVDDAGRGDDAVSSDDTGAGGGSGTGGGSGRVRGGTGDGESATDDADGGGCSASGTQAGASWFALALAALVARRRR